ncbi:hypothetical protein E2320_010699 [Naja naja]|nr:hypothetical protein E2320_010699 [Naja naja]
MGQLPLENIKLCYVPGTDLSQGFLNRQTRMVKLDVSIIYFAMENDLLRKLRENMKRLQKEGANFSPVFIICRKTMEISKLLTEKEQLELKIRELTNKNLQLAKEKEKLCEEYEEKLSRKSSSGESGQLDKLRRENESLSCKKEELRNKTEMLTFKNIQLSNETEALCREYEERLWSNLKILKEDSSKLSRYTLPEWLKASTTTLPKECDEASREDVNGWLHVSLSHLQEKGPETCDLDVQEWLEATIIGIQHLRKSNKFQKAWFYHIQNRYASMATNISEKTQMRISGRSQKQSRRMALGIHRKCPEEIEQYVFPTFHVYLAGAGEKDGRSICLYHVQDDRSAQKPTRR